MAGRRPFWQKNYGAILRNVLRAKLRPALFDAGELEFLRRGNGLLTERQKSVLPRTPNDQVLLEGQGGLPGCSLCSRLSVDEQSKLVALTRDVDRSLDVDTATKIQKQQILISELKSDLYWAKVKLERARRIMVLRDALHSLVSVDEWDRVRVEM